MKNKTNRTIVILLIGINLIESTRHSDIFIDYDEDKIPNNNSTNKKINEDDALHASFRSNATKESDTTKSTLDKIESVNINSESGRRNDVDTLENLKEPESVFEGPQQEEVDEAVKHGLRMMHDLYFVKEPLLYKMGFFLDPDEPAGRVAAFSAPNSKALLLARYGYATVQASLKLAQKYHESPGRANSGHSDILRTLVLADQCPLRGTPRCTPVSRRYRTPDGTCNNFDQPWRGSAMTPMQRFLPPMYEDGVQSPKRSVLGGSLPSARDISITIHKDEDREMSAVTLMFMQWGQFLDHDVTSTAQSRAFNGSVPRCCLPGGTGLLPPEFTHPECLPIPVPRDDWFLSHFGVRCLEFIRSAPSTRINCDLGWREQINQVTSYIDASMVYGSDAQRAEALRIFRGGQLQYGRRRGQGRLNPPDPPEGEICRTGAVSTACFLGGDLRVGEQPALTALHTIWLRCHNKLASTLQKLNPHWSDEKLYQEARRIIAALIQHITYREFLPILLGQDVMKLFKLTLKRKGYYTEYDERLNPSPANAFSTAAFRFGHSLVQNSFVRSTINHRSLFNSVLIHEEQDNPENIWSSGSLDRLILGLCNQASQRRDEFISDELTNHLFQSPNAPFGMDLVAINIQRGRDHGIPSYTAWREPCGLSEIKNWRDLERVMSSKSVERFRAVYFDVDDIDLYSGGLAEHPIRGGIVGPTFACIIAQQFLNFRKGDRFWYENGNLESSFTPAQLQQIRKVNFAQVICHTVREIDTIQPFVFLAADDFGNARISCDHPSIGRFDLTAWDEVEFHSTDTSNSLDEFRTENIIIDDKLDFILKDELQHKSDENSLNDEGIKKIRFDVSTRQAKTVTTNYFDANNNKTMNQKLDNDETETLVDEPYINLTNTRDLNTTLNKIRRINFTERGTNYHFLRDNLRNVNEVLDFGLTYTQQTNNYSHGGNFGKLKGGYENRKKQHGVLRTKRFIQHYGNNFRLSPKLKIKPKDYTEKDKENSNLQNNIMFDSNDIHSAYETSNQDIKTINGNFDIRFRPNSKTKALFKAAQPFIRNEQSQTTSNKQRTKTKTKHDTLRRGDDEANLTQSAAYDRRYSNNTKLIDTFFRFSKSHSTDFNRLAVFLRLPNNQRQNGHTTRTINYWYHNKRDYDENNATKTLILDNKIKSNFSRVTTTDDDDENLLQPVPLDKSYLVSSTNVAKQMTDVTNIDNTNQRIFADFPIKQYLHSTKIDKNDSTNRDLRTAFLNKDSYRLLRDSFKITGRRLPTRLKSKRVSNILTRRQNNFNQKKRHVNYDVQRSYHNKCVNFKCKRYSIKRQKTDTEDSDDKLHFTDIFYMDRLNHFKRQHNRLNSKNMIKKNSRNIIRVKRDNSDVTDKDNERPDNKSTTTDSKRSKSLFLDSLFDYYDDGDKKIDDTDDDKYQLDTLKEGELKQGPPITIYYNKNYSKPIFIRRNPSLPTKTYKPIITFTNITVNERNNFSSPDKTQQLRHTHKTYDNDLPNFSHTLSSPYAYNYDNFQDHDDTTDKTDRPEDDVFVLHNFLHEDDQFENKDYEKVNYEDKQINGQNKNSDIQNPNYNVNINIQYILQTTMKPSAEKLSTTYNTNALVYSHNGETDVRIRPKPVIPLEIIRRPPIVYEEISQDSLLDGQISESSYYRPTTTFNQKYTTKSPKRKATKYPIYIIQTLNKDHAATNKPDGFDDIPIYVSKPPSGLDYVTTKRPYNFLTTNIPQHKPTVIDVDYDPVFEDDFHTTKRPYPKPFPTQKPGLHGHHDTYGIYFSNAKKTTTPPIFPSYLYLTEAPQVLKPVNFNSPTKDPIDDVYAQLLSSSSHKHPAESNYLTSKPDFWEVRPQVQKIDDKLDFKSSLLPTRFKEPGNKDFIKISSVQGDRLLNPSDKQQYILSGNYPFEKREDDFDLDNPEFLPLEDGLDVVKIEVIPSDVENQNWVSFNETEEIMKLIPVPDINLNVECAVELPIPMNVSERKLFRSRS